MSARDTRLPKVPATPAARCRRPPPALREQRSSGDGRRLRTVGGRCDAATATACAASRQRLVCGVK